MRRPHVIVSGSLAHDRILNFPGRFTDHIIRKKIHTLSVSFTVATVRESFGGTAGNIGYTLSLLRVPVTIAAALGAQDARYRQRLRELKLWGLGIQPVATDDTAAAYIMTDRVDNQITAFYPGALRQPYTRKLQSLLRPHALNYALLAPAPVTSTARLGREAADHGIPYLFDPGQEITSYSRAQLRSLISGADVCIANDYEWSLIEKITGWTFAQLSKKTHITIQTLGHRGSVIWHHAKRYLIPPAKPANTVDPTGAGDAYRAGFVAGYLHGLPLPMAGRLASITSVYSVETLGTQTHHFNVAAVKKRYYQNYKSRLSL